MPSLIPRLNAVLGDRYHIERELGEGGMANVFLARDLKHKREVALKVLKPDLAAALGSERFLAEIETTAKLQHPHIVPLFDSGEADGLLFYVMPFIQGESLRQRLDRERQLPVDEAVRIAASLAEALDYAHRGGVVHRDLKPGNILLQDGKPVIADFGIALAVSSSGGDRLTKTGRSLGTPHYMSPEQATGDLPVGPPADIYAMGCVLYEMLVGEPPYAGTTAQAILARIITADVPSASAVRPAVRSHVDATIAKALEKLPADRFARAGEFAKALADPNFGDDGPAKAPVLSGLPWYTWLLAAVAALLVFALGRYQGSSGTRSAQLTRFSLAEAEYLGAGPGRNVTISPDGSWVVYIGPTDDGRGRLFLRALDRLEPQAIPGTTGARSPRFSPDGRALVFSRDDRLNRITLPASPVATLVASNVSDLSLSWSEDGMIYYVAADGSGVWRAGEEGGSAEQVLADDAVVSVEALPGGHALLYTRRSGVPIHDSIALLSLDRGESRILFGGSSGIYARSGHIIYRALGGLYARAFQPNGREIGESGVSLELEVVGAQFAISQTGTLIHYAAGTPSAERAVWVSREGEEEIVDLGRSDRINDLVVSPDGTKVALAIARADIWIYDWAQQVLSRLTFDPAADYYPFWSPDGREVGFTSQRNDRVSLYWRPVDGSQDASALIVGTDLELYEGAWMPDGSGVVYRAGRAQGSSSDLWLWSRETGEAQPLFVSEGRELSPSVSPDGRWLAYASEETGQFEVYVRRLPEGAATRVSRDGGANPRWTRGGEELVYLPTETARHAIIATVQTDPEFAVLDRRVAFESAFERKGSFAHPHWDLSPDGERMLIIATLGTDRPARYVVTQNLHQTLADLRD